MKALIIISLLLFVISILTILYWTNTLDNAPDFPPAPNYTKAGLGMKCTLEPEEQTLNTPQDFNLTECMQGLICVNGFCFRDMNEPCNSLAECTPEAIVCDKKCSY